MADEGGGELERLRAENTRLRDRYDRLRRRKSVRLALWLAGLPARTKRPAATSTISPSPRIGAPAVGSDRASDGFGLELLAGAPTVTVVIPAFNAPDALGRCLESVVAHTSTAAQVIVIDDASTDLRVQEVLERYEDAHGLRVVHNDANLGFTATANRGMGLVSGDVILLNADAEVPPRWVEGLRRAAYSDGDIASSTAISNNAGAFSAPVAGGAPAPTERTVAELGRNAARTGVRVLPTPTANGFCCYLKRAAIDDVGTFDAEAFPRGYGEENDWSLRASARGWRHVVAADVYVVHARSASFGAERTELSGAGARILASRHPGYQGRFDRFVGDPRFAELRRQVGDELARPPVRPRVLAIIHGLGGGTELSARDLAGAVRGYEVLILKCSPGRWVLSNAAGERQMRIDFEAETGIADFVSMSQRRALAQILVDFDIEIVHLRHSMYQSVGNVEAVRAHGVPVVVSLHDYYLICPTAHLVDDHGRFCAGTCTAGQGVCPADPWVTAGPHLKHAWVKQWQLQARALLESVDGVQGASPFVLDLHREVLGPVGDGRSVVIAHGRDLERRHDLATAPPTDAPMKILMAGTIGDHKGNEVVRAVLARVSPGTFEFHVLGTFPGEPCDGVVVHGRYGRDDMASMVETIRPSVAAILSVTPETWSHTLTEFWAMGLPVVVTDVGAPVERISEQGGGWIVAAGDVDATVDLLTAIRSDAAGFDQKAAEARSAVWSTTAEMAAAYEEMFDEVLGSRRTVKPPPRDRP